MVNWDDINSEDLEIAERAFNHGIKKEEYEELFQNPIKKRRAKNKGEVRYIVVGKVYGKYILAIIAPTANKLRIFSGMEAPDEYKKLYEDC